ncbi:M1 family aminopeptidase [Temperatibacter marinus]|uniref:Aminopeptidase N n=1 Tax=Temperatibacter marinus TaxID=1456591 RepID=A0AA52EFF8_9PROT|nr:M1 family aminopeptidase [Temperatibacter marinus]WND01349.1 M1 family aminopeptidase [Temperatibacter marinus]
MRFILIIFVLCLSACTSMPKIDGEGRAFIKVKEGVSADLMAHRKSVITDLRYTISVSIPASYEQDISATTVINVNLTAVSQDLQIDFQERSSQLLFLSVNGTRHPVQHEKEHLIIQKEALTLGENVIEIRHLVGESALNRNSEFLYTLFVPDRARTAFPIFDQPNLKARYTLTLSMPKEWTALSAAPILKIESTDKSKIIQFEESDLMSSYLFSFVAGKFHTIEKTIKGRLMTLLHRESDTAKVDRNIDALFTLHAQAIDWLEEYTGIKYPFMKFGFAVLPGFPFGGMEHTGAIQYRDASLFLPENPSQAALLSRASLISHEVAHMWFGNLVTMNWFDDVWTKEVYANFMAAKIINPSFPDVDHNLNFFLDHYPDAYAVDRTIGANSIYQNLENLNEAGSLYGAIIYKKAPIMMRQLELLLGKDNFQKGIQDYLKTFANKNATWPQLIEIFDRYTDIDVKSWSDVWVNSAGRPSYKNNAQTLQQYDSKSQGRIWPQKIDDNLGYGLFPANIESLYDNWGHYSDIEKGTLFINLYEQMLENNPLVRPLDLLNASVYILEQEKNTLLITEAVKQIETLFWGFLGERQRHAKGAFLEETLWTHMVHTPDRSLKGIFFRAYQSIAMTERGLKRLTRLWEKDLTVPGLRLSEDDLIALTAILAIKQPARASAYLDTQRSRIKNKDRLSRFDYLRPTLSSSKRERLQWFYNLQYLENRYTERWVLSGISYLHHPLRREEAEKLILSSLLLMRDIQLTGSIFFPTRFIQNTLKYHSSSKVEKTIRRFLQERRQYNAQLRLKILQPTDLVRRKVKIKKSILAEKKTKSKEN